MCATWTSPHYRLKSHKGREVVIDVTLSCSPGLPANKIIAESLIPLLKDKKFESVLDFGAGNIRQSLPLLKRGFQVCAVEFQEQFGRPACADALARAKKNPNFSTLIYPRDFGDDGREFDVALLCYVLQTMPLPAERKLVLKLLKKKLKTNAYLVYMSRYNQVSGLPVEQRVSDGFFMRPDNSAHSFYREFTTEETHAMFAEFGFRRLRSLSERGTDQIYLYGRGSATWA